MARNQRWTISFRPEAGRFGVVLPEDKAIVASYNDVEGWFVCGVRLGFFPNNRQILRDICDQVADNFGIPRKYVRIRKILRKK